MNPRRGSAKALHDARVRWLQVHPPDDEVPGLNDDVDDTGRAALEALRLRMHGLFGASQAPDIQRETIRRLVSELRGESVRVEW